MLSGMWIVPGIMGKRGFGALIYDHGEEEVWSDWKGESSLEIG